VAAESLLCVPFYYTFNLQNDFDMAMFECWTQVDLDSNWLFCGLQLFDSTNCSCFCI